jgi:hypothetical protein
MTYEEKYRHRLSTLTTRSLLIAFQRSMAPGRSGNGLPTALDELCMVANTNSRKLIDALRDKINEKDFCNRITALEQLFSTKR